FNLAIPDRHAEGAAFADHGSDWPGAHDVFAPASRAARHWYDSDTSVVQVPKRLEGLRQQAAICGQRVIDVGEEIADVPQLLWQGRGAAKTHAPASLHV